MDADSPPPDRLKRPWLRGIAAVGVLFLFGTLMLLSVVFQPANSGASQYEIKELIKRMGGASWEREPTEFIRRIKRTVNDARFKRVRRVLDRIFPPVLDHVRLEKGRISTNFLSLICQVPTIRILDIPGPRLSADHWQIIAATTNIEAFHVNGPAVHLSSIPLLSGMPHLRHLSLESNLVTDKHLAVIRFLTNLTELSLNGSGVSGPGLTHLRGLRHLVHLDLSYSPITDDYLSNLAGLTTLESLSLGEKISDAGIPYILPLKNLQSVGFMNSEVDNPGLDVVLKAFPKLNHLNLSHVAALMSQLNLKAYPHVTLEAAF